MFESLLSEDDDKDDEKRQILPIVSRTGSINNDSSQNYSSAIITTTIDDSTCNINAIDSRISPASQYYDCLTNPFTNRGQIWIFRIEKLVFAIFCINFMIDIWFCVISCFNGQYWIFGCYLYFIAVFHAIEFNQFNETLTLDGKQIYLPNRCVKLAYSCCVSLIPFINYSILWRTGNIMIESNENENSNILGVPIFDLERWHSTSLLAKCKNKVTYCFWMRTLWQNIDCFINWKWIHYALTSFFVYELDGMPVFVTIILISFKLFSFAFFVVLKCYFTSSRSSKNGRMQFDIYTHLSGILTVCLVVCYLLFKIAVWAVLVAFELYYSAAVLVLVWFSFNSVVILSIVVNCAAFQWKLLTKSISNIDNASVCCVILFCAVIIFTLLAMAVFVVLDVLFAVIMVFIFDSLILLLIDMDTNNLIPSKALNRIFRYNTLHYQQFFIFINQLCYLMLKFANLQQTSNNLYFDASKQLACIDYEILTFMNDILRQHNADLIKEPDFDAQNLALMPPALFAYLKKLKHMECNDLYENAHLIYSGLKLAKFGVWHDCLKVNLWVLAKSEWKFMRRVSKKSEFGICYCFLIMVSISCTILWPVYVVLVMIISYFFQLAREKNTLFCVSLESAPFILLMIVGVLMIFIIICLCCIIYLKVKYLLPLHLRMYCIFETKFVQCLERVFEMTCQLQRYSNCDASTLNIGFQIIECIESHLNSLKSRPLKEAIIIEMCGKDIGSVIIEFLPLHECIKPYVRYQFDY